MATFVPTLHLQPYSAISPTLPQVSAKGKSVIITGGGHGIGRAIPDAFAAAGAARIAISGRTESKLKTAVAELKATYPNTEFTYFVADITDAVAVQTMFDSFGAPDVLVNNAGFLPTPSTFKAADLKEWWMGFEINVLGTAIVTQAFLRAKPEGKEAVIVTLNTLGAHVGTYGTNFSSYFASKAGSLRLSETLQAEHPEVRFVSVHPGGVETDMYEKTGYPKGNFTDPAVAANFILWLTSPEADFLAGRFAWANWDLDELKAKKEEILKKDLLKYTLGGFV